MAPVVGRDRELESIASALDVEPGALPELAAGLRRGRDNRGLERASIRRIPRATGATSAE